MVRCLLRGVEAEIELTPPSSKAKRELKEKGSLRTPQTSFFSFREHTVSLAEQSKAEAAPDPFPQSVKIDFSSIT